MRSTIVFGYLAAAVVALLVLSLAAGWTGWVVVAAFLLAMPMAVWIAIGTRGQVPWTSVLVCLSGVALVAAVVSELAGWTTGRTWFLLLWTVFLLPVSVTLFRHTMRGPAWGLFVGFWGTVAVIMLIALQGLAAAGVLSGSEYTGWTAWPLAVIGIWILVASGAGFGCATFGRVCDALGLLTGLSLIAISVASWASAPDLIRLAGSVAAVLYIAWVGVMAWRFGRVQPAGQAYEMLAAPAH